MRLFLYGYALLGWVVAMLLERGKWIRGSV